jgi:hypothetical protein
MEVKLPNSLSLVFSIEFIQGVSERKLEHPRKRENE